jgi:hypothetical protein
MPRALSHRPSPGKIEQSEFFTVAYFGSSDLYFNAYRFATSFAFFFFFELERVYVFSTHGDPSKA